MKARRLVIKDACGEDMLTDARGVPLRHWEIDLTGIPNANSTVPMKAAVQEQCNLGCWHDVEAVPLPLWGAD